jgi:hypothetical protein
MPAKIVTRVALVDEHHLLIDEIAGDDAVVLLSQRLKIAADDGGGNAQIEERDVEALGLQLSRRDRHVTHAVFALRVEGGAWDARSHAIGVARTYCAVNNGRSGGGRAAWLGRARAKA